MPTFGPIYCETPGFVIGVFPAEPINTFSNLAIIFFSIAAFFLVTRRTPRAIDLYVLCALLLVNGVGSFLWHGTRTRWALSLDVLPALIFVFGFFFIWARRISPVWQALLLLLGFYVLSQFLRSIDFVPYGRWASMMPAVVLFGSWLIWSTWAHSRRAALLGAAALGTALLGLTFRTIDETACNYIPFGTHFLWHIFNGAVLYLAMRSLVVNHDWMSKAGGAEGNVPSSFNQEA